MQRSCMTDCTRCGEQFCYSDHNSCPNCGHGLPSECDDEVESLDENDREQLPQDFSTVNSSCLDAYQDKVLSAARDRIEELEQYEVPDPIQTNPAQFEFRG